MAWYHSVWTPLWHGPVPHCMNSWHGMVWYHSVWSLTWHGLIPFCMNSFMTWSGTTLYELLPGMVWYHMLHDLLLVMAWYHSVWTPLLDMVRIPFTVWYSYLAWSDTMLHDLLLGMVWFHTVCSLTLAWSDTLILYWMISYLAWSDYHAAWSLTWHGRIPFCMISYLTWSASWFRTGWSPRPCRTPRGRETGYRKSRCRWRSESAGTARTSRYP